MDALAMSKRIVEVQFAPANGGNGTVSRFKVMTGLIGYVNCFKGLQQRRIASAHAMSCGYTISCTQ